MGQDIAGGATLGNRSNYPSAPPQGAQPASSTQTPDDSNKASRESSAPKPSDTTGDPYDDHPGMVYDGEGPYTRKDMKNLGEDIGTDAGNTAANGADKATAGIVDIHKTAPRLGRAIGRATIGSQSFTEWVNNGYNLLWHPDAVYVEQGEPDWGASVRE